jgi:hypothetical protein
MEVLKALQSRGIDPSNPPPALQADHHPHIDAYAALQTRTGANQDAPIAITAADDQPYPFYGRVRVSWK